jgi:CBS domain-containing protein
MRKNEPITHIMTRNPYTGHLGPKPSEVRKVFAEHRFHHLPVVSGGRLVGMLASSDVLRVFSDAWGTDARAMDVAVDAQYSLDQWMVKDPVHLGEHSTVRDAAHALARGEFHAVPVTHENGELLGIVTSTDLIRYLIEQVG